MASIEFMTSDELMSTITHAISGKRFDRLPALLNRMEEIDPERAVAVAMVIAAAAETEMMKGG